MQNISKLKFYALKLNLNKIEKKAEVIFCATHNARIDRRDDYADALGVSMSWYENEIKGNIGIILNEKSSKLLFEFVVIKSRDVNNIRYWRQAVICENKSLGYIYEHLDELLRLAYNRWVSWSEKDLMNIVDLAPYRR